MYRALLLGAALAASAPATQAQLPVSGRPVPSLTAFDDAMQAFMDDNDLTAGVLGVMAEDRVVYLRGFGHSYNGTTPLPENALFRLASCSKPFTAAVVRDLIADGAFGTEDFAYDLGQVGGGVLSVTPWDGVADDRMDEIRVRHLIDHTSGFSPVGGDRAFHFRQAALDMGVPSPPPRPAMMDWTLGVEPLEFSPGLDVEYSNLNYLTLDLIAEQESGQDLVSYIRQRILTPEMWVPSTEIKAGRTFRPDQDAREPRYEHPGLSNNIYDNTLPYEQVSPPYGEWSQEGLQGFGGLVASAPAMLEFLRRYHAIPFNNSFGHPIGGSFPTPGNGAHAGSLRGTNTWMQQRSDGVFVFIAFNSRSLDIDRHYGNELYAILAPLIDAVTTWPTATSDGFWVNMGGIVFSGFGSYNRPFASFTSALASTEEGSKLRLKAGSSDWTGVLSERLLLDAPLGSAVLGE